MLKLHVKPILMDNVVVAFSKAPTILYYVIAASELAGASV
jgi:hypothetical protein